MTSPYSRALVCTVFASILAGALYPGRALADDAARISQLESEIQRLRTQLNEQNRRIQRLEEELSQRRGGAVVGAVSEARVKRSATAPAEPQPWHSPEPWSQIAKGMSEAQVTEILGSPTSVESLDGYKTLFYRGPAGKAGELAGHVNLRDERVVAVMLPIFGR